MHWAQGTRPDPHELLLLHPSAPSTLVVEVHRLLATRAKKGTAGVGDASMLEAAYREAMAIRASGDPIPDDEACHYAMLCLDPGADAEMIDLAYRTLQERRPLPRHSITAYRRTEAHRVLSNAVLRARYDDGRVPATMRSPAMRAPARAVRIQPADTGNAPRKDNSVAIEKKRGLFGLRRSRAPEVDPVDARIRDLREQLPIAPEEERPEQEDEQRSVALPAAEITFTAGPRAGLRIELESNVAPLGEGKSTATIWRHGERFLMRHNGKKILVSGTAPVLGIVVLEDGDEIVAGADHASFRLIPPAS